ncbi:MAG: glycerol-3-phosphate dehydrogenase [Flavobacteriales bacterium]|jgi:glycerol-3-phosphate dehydrogenase
MTRTENTSKLKSESFDLLVIGGGITGAGIALDARLRGLKTALIEMNDFASGTSSRSSKLIHGGLRYLKQLEFKLVNEVGRERAIVHHLAPHLVHPDKMLLPLVKDGNYGYWLTSMGLSVYDFLAGVSPEDRRQMLDEKETLEAEPLLRKEILEGGGLYAEYRTDDARLVMAVIQSAAAENACIANYVKAEDLLVSKGQVVGAKVKDLLSNSAFKIKAKVVVNATGPWVDEVRSLNEKITGKRLHLTKGIHLVVPRAKLPIKQTVYFDHSDRRMIFAIPRGNVTYLGTTDTDFKGDKMNPRVTLADANYILEAVNYMFPEQKIVLKDVLSSWAGLRPLIHEEGKSASSISRKDEIFNSDNGLISIAGGKLTGYRKMAERVTDEVANRLEVVAECTTDQHKLFNASFKDYAEVETEVKRLEKVFPTFAETPYEIEYIVHNYGRVSQGILEQAEVFLATNNSEVALVLAELAYTTENEMVCSLQDFFDRRTGRINFNIDSVRRTKARVGAELAKIRQWNASELAEELRALDEVLKERSTFD